MISLSVVIPCLNEEESLEFCLKKIKKIFLKKKFKFTEIIVVDNGSTDNSLKIAKKYKARIINEKTRGYGSALKTGINASRGEYVCFADADDSYNFLELPKFIKKANEGFDLIQGCRFPSGGGTIKKGAMPFSHKYFGNPFLSLIARIFFKIKFNDIYCGFRMFKKKTYKKNFYFSNGMEFAVENLIKLDQSSSKSCEIPITLHRDKRIKNQSHLKTFSDGFKTLKFILTCGNQSILLIFGFLIVFCFSGKLVFSNSLSTFDNVFIFGLSTLFLIQIIFFFFFSNLISEYLGFKKNNNINKIYKYINFNYSFVIALFLFIFFVLIYIFDSFKILNFDSSQLNLYLTLILISFQILVNILIVSVIEFFKKK
jgi:glycosyltransferase involved in cell wall biosynthesis